MATDINREIRRRAGWQPAEERVDGATADPAAVLGQLVELRESDQGTYDRLSPAVRAAVATFEAVRAAAEKE